MFDTIYLSTKTLFPKIDLDFWFIMAASTAPLNMQTVYLTC